MGRGLAAKLFVYNRLIMKLKPEWELWCNIFHSLWSTWQLPDAAPLQRAFQASRALPVSGSAERGLMASCQAAPP